MKAKFPLLKTAIKKVMSTQLLLIAFSTIMSTILISTSLLYPVSALTEEPENPKSNHIPQLMVDAPGGLSINSWNGNLFYNFPILSLPATGIPIDVNLSYNSTWFDTERSFGTGWQLSYNMYYIIEDDLDVAVTWLDGRSQTFKKSVNGYASSEDTYEVLEEYAANQFKITTKSKAVYFFENSSHKKLTKMVDQNGNTLILDYDASGNLIKIINPSNRSVSLTYSNDKLSQIKDDSLSTTATLDYTGDNLTSITDIAGAVFSFEYTDRNLLKKITNPKNEVVDIEYTHTGVVSNVRHSNGAFVYFGYDLVTKTTTVIKNSLTGKYSTMRYFYNEEGQIIKVGRIKDEFGNLVYTLYEWDSKNNLTKYTDEIGRIWRQTYDSNGNILTLTDPDAKVYTYTYNPTFNKLESTTDPQGNTTSYTYDSSGNLVSVTDALGNTTTISYSSTGQVLSETNPLGGTMNLEYDQNGNLVKITDSAGNTTQSSYDAAGREISQTDQLGNVLNKTYSTRNQILSVTDALNQTTSFSYDEMGLQVSVTDANSNISSNTYDSFGNLKMQTNALGKTISTTYDYNGNLLEIIDENGNRTKYEYDYLGRLTKETDALNNSTTYYYDEANRLINKTDANGNVVSYSYDSLDRLTFVDYSDDSDVEYTYDSLGNILSESTNDQSVYKTYDALGRVISERIVGDSIDKTVSYTYDANGNLVQKNNTDYGSIAYEYNSTNLLVRIDSDKSGATNFEYNAKGMITQKQLPNGIRQEYEYDAGGRLSGLTNKKSDDSIISSTAYTYDAVGNKLSQTKNSAVTNYSYDSTYKLTNVTYPDSSFESYTYDSVGNRLTKQTESFNTSYSYNAINSLVTEGSITYEYDANGNLTKKIDGSDITNYTYSASNKLVNISYTDSTSNNYSYYANGLRYSTQARSGDVTKYIYSGSNILYDTDENGNIHKAYTSTGTDIWIGYEENNEDYIYLTDSLGSVDTIFDSAENEIESYEYGAYGDIVSFNENTDNVVAFAGREFDADSGMYYNRARYLDPSVGRFTQLDPSGMVDGTNMYAYTQNNPVNYVDPSGKFLIFTFSLINKCIVHCSLFISKYINPPDQTPIGKVLGEEYTEGLLLDTQKQFANKNYLERLKYTVETSAPGSGTSDRKREQLVDQGYTHAMFEGELHDISGPGNILFGYQVKRLFFPLGLPFLVGDIDQIIKYHEPIDRYDDKMQIFQGYHWTGKSTESTIFQAPQSAFVVLGNGSNNGLFASLGDVDGVHPIYLVDLSGTGWVPGDGGIGNNPFAWQIDYYNGTNLTNFTTRVTGSTSDNFAFDWGMGSPGPTGNDHFSARLSKSIYFDRSGDWGFRISANDGVRLFVDGQQIFNEWWGGGHNGEPTKYLEAGYHDIVIEYYDEVDEAYLHFEKFRDYSGEQGVWLCTVTGWYENHRNDCMRFTEDAPSLGQAGIGNDTVKSISLVGGWHAVLFVDDNFSGNRYFVHDNFSDLNATPIGQNQASSLMVRKYLDGPVTLYDQGDLNGEQFKTGKDLMNLSFWEFNDRAESIKIENGYEVVVCEHDNMHGNCGRATGGSYNDIRELHPSLREPNQPWEGRATSLKICEGNCPAAPRNANLVAPSNGVNFVAGSTQNFQWFGNGEEFYVEITGGDLTNPVIRNWSNLTYVSQTLAASNNPYYWRVKSWNQYGESDWSEVWSFRVSNQPVVEISANVVSTAFTNTDIVVDASIIPASATQPVVYTWSPTPKSGQGSLNPVFNFNTPGQKSIKFTASNIVNSITEEYSIDINCEENMFEAEYFLNEDLNGDAVSSACVSDLNYDWGDSSPDLSDGKNLVVNSGETFYTDDVRMKVNQDAVSGSNLVCVSNPEKLVFGDLILIIQSQGTNVGNYEYKRVLGSEGCMLTLDSGLVNSYSASSGKAQVQLVHEYRNVIVNGTITAHAWDGNTGGIVMFKAYGDTTVNEGGTIKADGLGFRGGRMYRNEEGEDDAVTGESGESIYGQNAWIHTWNGENPSPIGVISNGGGSGGAGRRGPDTAGGGAGGGHLYSGSGGTSYSGAQGGVGGQAYSTLDSSKIFFGSGGGGGGRAKDAYASEAPKCNGGAGGGIILIQSESLSIPGTITSYGADGNTTVSNCGGGGAGAGGGIILQANVLNHIGQVRPYGGIGGVATTSESGGNGALGLFVAKYCDSYTGANGNAVVEQSNDCNLDHFSARWTKKYSVQDGEYNLVANADDGVKVFVNGTTLIDDWNLGYSENLVTTTLPTGIHTVTVEYFEEAGNANIYFDMYPSSNDAPVMTQIENQFVAPADNFADINLNDYATDPNSDEITYSATGQSELTVNISTDGIATVTSPQNWAGEEIIEFTATDVWGLFASVDVKFTKLSCNPDEFLAEYYDNPSLNGDAVSVVCESEIDKNWGEEGFSGSNIVDFGTGADGDLTVNAGETVYTDNVRFQFSGNASVGSTAIALTGTSGFNIGDEVMVIQPQNIESEAGRYEIKRITGVTANTISLDSPLSYSYIQISGGHKAQVIRIPNYNDVTVNGTLTAHQWNGVGGIVAFRVKNDLTIGTSGKIDVRGKGFRGGGYTFTGGFTQQYRGEGYTQLGSQQSRDRNTIGGGGGRNESGHNAYDQKGAGGGGHATAGTSSTQSYGVGGGTYGTPDLSQRLTFGGGGGISGRDWRTGAGQPNIPTTHGGGGAIFIVANEVNNNGMIDARGETGYEWSICQLCDGGGGAGGSIYLTVGTMQSSGTISAVGASGFGYRDDISGNGGLGRIHIDSCIANQSYSTTPAIGTQNTVNCGDNFSVRWSGFKNLSNRDYDLITQTDDGVKLYVNDELVIDEWNIGYSQNSVTTNLNGWTKIVMEYFENTGNAEAKLIVNPSNNQAPVINSIQNQYVGPDESFTNFDLDDYAFDPENDQIGWSFNSQIDLGVDIDTQNVVSITTPEDWFGEESINFVATDSFGASSEISVKFTKLVCNEAEFFGEFFNNQDLSENPNFTQCDDAIDYDWGSAGFDGVPSVEAYWKFENNLEDSTGNGYDATSYGDIQYAMGYDGQTLWIDSDHIVPATQVSFADTNEYSFTGWFLTSHGGTPQSIFSLTGDGDQHGITVQILADGKIQLLNRLPSIGGNDSVITTDFSVNDGNWHNFAAVRAQDAELFYIDGVLIGTNVNSQMLTESYDMAIGREGVNLESRYFRGYIDELRMFKHPLNQNHVMQLISTNTSLPSDHISARWTSYKNFEDSQYTFNTFTDDGVKLFIDNEIVIDNWTNGYFEGSVTQNLSGWHKLTLEYFEDTANANAKFELLFGNRAPEIISTPVIQVDEMQTYSYPVIAQDADEDELSFELLEAPVGMQIDANTGVVTWAPTTADIGVHQVNLQVTDGEYTDTQSYSIVVNDVNLAPTLLSIATQTTNEDTAFAVIDLDDYGSDPDIGDIVSFTISSSDNLDVALDSENMLRVSPVPNYNGTQILTVTISDQLGLEAQTQVEFVVTALNDAPTFQSTPLTSVNEDESYTYDVEAIDVDNDTLIYSLSQNPQGMSIDASLGTISWLPDNSNVGIHSITVVVSDGIENVGQSFELTVVNTNDAPTISGILDQVIFETETFTFFDLDNYANDIDQGDSLSYAVSGNLNINVAIDSENIVTFTYVDGWYGIEEITFTVNDFSGASASQQVRFTVNQVQFCDSVTDVTKPECEALEALYISTNGDGWVNNSNWFNSTEVCSWYGVKCNSSKAITQLTLKANNLNGNIPDEISQLISLQYLRLNNNNLTGSIPQSIGSMQSLRNLELQNNPLNTTIPTELGSAQNLRVINLQSTSLSGGIPASLGNLQSLVTLNLSNNNLSGSIPSELFDLSSLKTLYLHKNNLSGNLPNSIGSMPVIANLNLSANQLDGNIPNSFGSLTSLITLNLSSNQLSGSIPTELGSLTLLKNLYLQNNQLSGGIPDGVSGLTSLVNFNASNNLLDGAISEDVGSWASVVTFNVAGNMLSGSIPQSIGSMNSLKYLYLQNNNLSGNIPESLGGLNSLVKLNLSYNKLSGSILPSEVSGLTSLTILQLNNNEFTSIPESIGNLTYVQKVYLQNNKLEGLIPASIQNAQTITHLYLQNNALVGSIPDSIQNLSNLVVLNIAYNGLYSNNVSVVDFLNSVQPTWQNSQTIAPTGLTGSGLTADSAKLTWNLIKYKGGAGYYEVLYRQVGDIDYTRGCVTTAKNKNTCTVTSLSPATEYEFVVRTFINAHGAQINDVMSDYSEMIEISTL